MSTKYYIENVGNSLRCVWKCLDDGSVYIGIENSGEWDESFSSIRSLSNSIDICHQISKKEASKIFPHLFPKQPKLKRTYKYIKPSQISYGDYYSSKRNNPNLNNAEKGLSYNGSGWIKVCETDLETGIQNNELLLFARFVDCITLTDKVK